MKTKRKVVLSFLGNSLDLPTHEDRWKKWRPNVSLGQFPDLLVDRVELFTEERYEALNETVVGDLRAVSPETQVELRFLNITDPWNFEQVFETLFQFARDYPFDVDREDYLINITTGTHVVQICLFLLTESRHLPGRLLQLSPPKRKSSEGLNPGGFSIIDLDLSQYDRLASRFETEAAEAADFLKSGIQTRNKSFNHMIDRIEKVAVRSYSPILLTGPTGAGKSRLARRIYEFKKQRNQVSGPFVEVNCSTLRGDTAMSTLFGHTRGAFTGAAAARAGLLKSAHGGVLFLDEIGELGMDEQSMLLRAIEEKRFFPVGADREVESDFQLISGTNRDLIAQVAEGSFRGDLFARMNLWLFELPGLRQRREDIEPNIAYELDQISNELGRKVSFNKEGFEAFLAFAKDANSLWTGNFRDLNAAITRMATLAGDRRIGRSLVEEEADRLRHLWRMDGSTETQILDEFFSAEQIAEIDRFDQVQLAEVIRACRESRNLSEAGRKLFAASRKRRKSSNDSDRVRKFLLKYDLDWGVVTES